MTHHSPCLLVLVLLLGVAVLSLSSGAEATVDFGYPNKCFFSVAKSDGGTWWFVDPKGERFFSTGVDVVNYGGDSSLNGTRAYHDTVVAKYANQSAWADAAVSRIVSWSMNTMGAWCDSVAITKGMPYTRALSLGKIGVTTGWSNGMFPDVYDPAWEAAVVSAVKTGCLPFRNDPLLIGYFLDNEMWWGPDVQGDDRRLNSTFLDRMLITLDATAPGHIQAVSFLKNKYPTVDALNQAWNTTFPSLDGPFTWAPKSTNHTADADAFAYQTSVRFFNVCRTAIKQYDPYHMLLGVRFMGQPRAPVIKACGEYNEVVSINAYPSASEPYGPPLNRVNQYYNISQRPILIGEFAYMGRDSGLPSNKGGGLLVDTQTQRAAGYRNYTTRLAVLPYIVGAHWFQWVDQPAEGRSPDGENGNYGLVNKDDEPYTILVDEMTNLIPQLWTMHESASTGLSSSVCLSELTCPNDCSGNGCCDTSTGVCTCQPGFQNLDCSLDASQLSTYSFGSELDTSVWTPLTTTRDGIAFSASKVSTEDGKLKLSISPCSTCSGANFTGGGVVTKINQFGYGIYTARFRGLSNTGFQSQLALSGTPAGDYIRFHSYSNTTNGFLDYDGPAGYKYLDWITLSPNPSLDFHNFSIHYLPGNFSFYFDDKLVRSYNNSVRPTPTDTMAVSIYLSASSTSPHVEDYMLIESVTYELVGGSQVDCPDNGGGDDGNSAAAGLRSGLGWLLASASAFFV